MNQFDYEQILLSAPLALALFNAREEIIFSNSTFLKELEWSLGETQNKKIKDFFQLESNDKETLKKSSQGEFIFNKPLLCQHSNGELSEHHVIVKNISIPSSKESIYYFEVLNKMSLHQSSKKEIQYDIDDFKTALSQQIHDLSNPLSLLKVHIDSLAVSPNDTAMRAPKMAKSLQRVIDAAAQLKKLLK